VAVITVQLIGCGLLLVQVHLIVIIAEVLLIFKLKKVTYYNFAPLDVIYILTFVMNKLCKNQESKVM
jgi:hypothetical protein